MSDPWGLDRHGGMAKRSPPPTYSVDLMDNDSCEDPTPTWDVIGHLYEPDEQGGWHAYEVWCADSFPSRTRAAALCVQLNRGGRS